MSVPEPERSGVPHVKSWNRRIVVTAALVTTFRKICWEAPTAAFTMTLAQAAGPRRLARRFRACLWDKPLARDGAVTDGASTGERRSMILSNVIPQWATQRLGRISRRNA